MFRMGFPRTRIALCWDENAPLPGCTTIPDAGVLLCTGLICHIRPGPTKSAARGVTVIRVTNPDDTLS